MAVSLCSCASVKLPTSETAPEQFARLGYAEKKVATGPDLTGRVDIFDPGNEIGSMDGVPVTGINGLAVAQVPASDNPNPLDMILHPGDATNASNNQRHPAVFER